MSLSELDEIKVDEMTTDDLLELLDELAMNGWPADFHTRRGTQVVCEECAELIPAEDVITAGLHRVDDDTDPEAQSLVVRVTCPRCGARGTLVCGYGPTASADDAAVLAALPPYR